MGDNCATSNLTAYNGSYWQDVNVDDLSTKLVYTGDVSCIKSNWDYDYGVTLNEDAIKDIVEKLTKSKETAKITPDEGPEIPKWTGFLPI
jgi:hypothetical protein